MNAERFSEFSAQARLNLDPNEHVVFIYDGAPAHRRPNQLGPNTELKMLPPYSPFLNIVEQAISALKAAIKADISRPEVQERMNNSTEARDRGVALGVYRTHNRLQNSWHTLQNFGIFLMNVAPQLKKITFAKFSPAPPINVDHSFRYYGQFVSGQHCAGGRGGSFT